MDTTRQETAGNSIEEVFQINSTIFFNHAKLTAIAIFLVLMTLVGYVVTLERSRLTETNKFLLLQQLSTTKATLEGLITANIMVLNGLRAELILDSTHLEQQEFSQRVALLMSDDLQIRHVAIAPDLVVKYIYPLEGNEAVLGLDYRQKPAQLEAIMAAMTSQKTTLAGPVNLIQGGRALITRIPIILPDNQEQWGLISAVIRLDQLLDKAGIHFLAREHQVSIQGKDGLGYGGDMVWGEPLAQPEDAVTVQIQLPNGTWILSAAPRLGWQVAISDYIYLLLIGVSLALLLSMASHSLIHIYHQRKLALQRSTYQAHYDSLTGLANRHYFHIKLDELIDDCERSGNIFALFFIDLDHFKTINDTLGHATGDEFLRTIANRLQNNIRKTDIVARLAGDEFVVIMKAPALLEQVTHLGKKLALAVNQEIHSKNTRLNSSASIGIAMYPDDGVDGDTLLKHADKAMYRAKELGRNQSYLFNNDLRQQLEVHQHLQTEIITGLENNQFRIHYQPIIGNQKDQAIKAEALIRWQHPTRGLLPPGEFIPFAEQNGLIDKLDLWVLEQVCRDWRLFNQAGLPLTISVNRCSNEFATPKIDDRWLNLINSYQVPTSRIIFEITESLLMENNGQQLSTLKRLQQSGIKLAIDDFCTGYSALNFLRQYPTDYIKIDKCFIDDIQDNEQNQILVKALLTMADGLGIQSIAEGIETEEQLRLLQSMGCDYYQGYHIGKPMPLSAFIKCQPSIPQTVTEPDNDAGSRENFLR